LRAESRLKIERADAAIPSAGPGNQNLHALALGIERIGLVSLRFPLTIALILIGLTIGAGFGLSRIKVDDSLSQLFRSNTPEFRQYEEVIRFPGN
jgi:uncharacterized protein